MLNNGSNGVTSVHHGFSGGFSDHGEDREWDPGEVEVSRDELAADCFDHRPHGVFHFLGGFLIYSNEPSIHIGRLDSIIHWILNRSMK